MATVYARSNESFDQLLRRFRKEVQNEKVLTTARRKRFFVPNSEKRRKAKLRGIRKARKRQRLFEQRNRY